MITKIIEKNDNYKAINYQKTSRTVSTVKLLVFK